MLRTKSVAEAIQKFMSELNNPKGEKREVSTIRQYETVFSRLQKFCNDRGLSDLNQMHLEELMDFLDSWPTH